MALKPPLRPAARPVCSSPSGHDASCHTLQEGPQADQGLPTAVIHCPVTLLPSEKYMAFKSEDPCSNPSSITNLLRDLGQPAYPLRASVSP